MTKPKGTPEVTGVGFYVYVALFLIVLAAILTGLGAFFYELFKHFG